MNNNFLKTIAILCGVALLGVNAIAIVNTQEPHETSIEKQYNQDGEVIGVTVSKTQVDEPHNGSLMGHDVSVNVIKTDEGADVIAIDTTKTFTAGRGVNTYTDTYTGSITNDQIKQNQASRQATISSKKP